MSFINYVTQIQIDFGAVKLLQAECERVGIRKPLIVTDAGVKAAGGARAIAEDQAGRTQRVVVVERLTEVIRRELSAPMVAVPEGMQVSRFDGSPIALASTMIQ